MNVAKRARSAQRSGTESAAPDPAGQRGSEAGSQEQRTSPSSQTGAEGHLLQLLSADPSPLSSDAPFSGFDWRRVVSLAADHAVTPLLYWRLKQSVAQAHVPTGVWEALRRAYTAGAVRSMRIHGGLRTALHCLRDAGVPVILLKGAYLAEAVYADPAVRPMVDVDLLVPMAELPKAQASLLAIGGTHRRFEDIESCCRRKAHLPQVSLCGLAFEIHWTIAPPGGPAKVDVVGLWHRACPATVAGFAVRALSFEDLLLHVCLHACYQERLGGGLLPLCDIAGIVRRLGGEIDWAQVSARAVEWGAARHVGLMFLLARTMLEADVPDAVIAELVPAGVDYRVLAAARESVLARTGYGRWVPFFEAAHAANAADRAKLTWRRVFLSRDEMALVYPASCGARFLQFYYVRRGGHVLRSYARHTSRRAWLKMTRGRGPHAALVSWLSGKS